MYLYIWNYYNITVYSIVRFFVLGHAGYDVLPSPDVSCGWRGSVRRTSGQPLAYVWIGFYPQRMSRGFSRCLPFGFLVACRRFWRLTDFSWLQSRLFPQYVFNVGGLGPQDRTAYVCYTRAYFHRFL